MTPDDLAILAALLGALSVAAERLVEVLKGFVGWLDTQKDDEKLERRRRLVLHLLGILAGGVIAFSTWDALSLHELFPCGWGPLGGGLVLGLLSGGGSSFWNSFHTYVARAKDLRKEQAKQVRESVPRPTSGTGTKPTPRPSASKN